MTFIRRTMAAGALCLIALTSVAAGSAPAAALTASSVRPCSPDGICDARLFGTTSFTVNDGTYVHRFTWLGGHGDDDMVWQEDVSFWGIPTNSYTFSCGSSGCPANE
ncbi:hypothetical protein [Streptomyces guryensis]|uniref:Peptidase inhibitor family I36 n=1 Tax=Streptomyces guryensis TaxID=2886947 RepID=A0A9Q3ZD02_9ACTN|nr:hypothetical protein [Streptomyces guryensis]MCD9880182.1 hypothetical protein [Streptomyces guryensis]